jgi:TP901 family phage tail tape measure protein
MAGRALATAFVAVLPDGMGFGPALKAELAGATAPAGAAGEKSGGAFAKSFVGKVQKVSREITLGLAGVAAGIAVEGVRMAAKFNSDMELLVTQAGVAQNKLAGLKDGVLKLAGQVGFAPDSLADALFHIESNFASIGISGPKALNLLKVAAEGAAVGHANLVDVTNALSAMLASGIPGVKGFSQAMGVLNSIVGAGDMHMQDLAEAFGSGVVATVKGFGLTIQDVGAALDVFGDNNIRGAHAGTQLRMSVMSLAVPAKSASSYLKEMGLTTRSFAMDMQHGGLRQAMIDLISHLRKIGVTAKDQGDVITQMFGKKAGAGLNVLADQMTRFLSKYPALTKGARGFGEAWKKTQQTVQQQWNDLRAAFDAFLIKVGEKLLPVVMKVFNFVKDHTGAFLILGTVLAGLAVTVTAISFAMKVWNTAVTIGTGLAKLFAGATEATTLATGESVAAQEAGAGRVVAMWVAQAAKAVWSAGVQVASYVATAAAATAAFIAENAATLGIAAAIAALIIVIIFLATHWGRVWHDIKAWAEDAWKFLTHGWGQWLIPGLYLIRKVVEFVRDHWKAAWDAIKQAAMDVGQWLWTDFGAKIEVFFLHTVPGWLNQAFNFWVDNFIDPAKNALSDLYNWVWTDFGAKIYAFLTRNLPEWFHDAVTFIARTWDALENAVKVPVNWVIQYVYDDGIRKLWNFVANIVGLPDLPVVQTLAGGGRIAGFGGGDKHPALLEGGEAVVDKWTTKSLAPLFGALGVPGFTKGGVMGNVGNTGTSQAMHANSLLGGIGDYFKIMAALATGNKVALAHAFEDLFPGPKSSGARTGSEMMAMVAALPATVVGSLVRKAISAFTTSGAGIVPYAESFIGKVPYVWGGTTPSGWDCSGFTSYVYKHFGYSDIPRTAAAQQAWAQHTGTAVPGGLAFFAGADGTAASAGHVGIIINPSTMVDAYGTGFGTRLNDMMTSSGAFGGFGIPPGGFGHKTGPVNVPVHVRDRGGYLPPGLIWNGTGADERVVGPGADAAQIAALWAIAHRLDNVTDLLSRAPGATGQSLASELNGIARGAGYRAMYSSR